MVMTLEDAQIRIAELEEQVRLLNKDIDKLMNLDISNMNFVSTDDGSFQLNVALRGPEQLLKLMVQSMEELLEYHKAPNYLCMDMMSAKLGPISVIIQKYDGETPQQTISRLKDEVLHPAIAKLYGISVEQVKKKINSAVMKMGCNNNYEALLFC